ncbi:MAG TPA: glycosyltransferase, partial [Solirubrobacteraceae bacterium]|nr:glycosyltransferase [Solirubrobacteraceae bacterium]
AVLVYFLVVNGFLLLLLLMAAIDLRSQRLDVWQEGRWRLLGSDVAPVISILAPAHNEELTVTESVRSLLTLRYPSLEIVVVNDGSSDGTLERLQRDFDLAEIHAAPIRRRIETQPIRGLYRSRRTPSLVVVDKENGGKADALNAGLLVATGDLACAIDADTIVEPDALQRMIRPFLLDDRVVAAGGTLRVVNGCEIKAGRVTRQRAPRRFLEGVQAVEYLRAFLAGRVGWNRLGGNLIISGAFGLFRRESMITAGGYRHDTVGEDMDLVVNMRRLGYERGAPDRVVFVPDPVAWTEVPRRLRVLGRQRDRWHRGLADVVGRHRGIVLNPRYRAMGLVVAPYFVVVELLAPLVELVGLVALVVGLAIGAVNIPFAVMFLIVAYGLGLLITTLTIALEEWTYGGYGGLRDRLLLLLWGILESLGYRQLTAVWRVRGMLRHLRGRTDWGVMEREGFRTASEP